MRMCRAIASAPAAFALMSVAAQAQVLTVVEVGAPAVNCVFNPSCTITVSDTVGYIALPYLAAPQAAWLQSRTFTGASGTPGAGKTGYMYRISLTQAAGTADCLGGLVVNFGPVAKLPYKNNQLADVFVVTTGGVGTISLKSAEKFGNVIEFTLAKPAWPAARTRTTRPSSSGWPPTPRRCRSRCRYSAPGRRRCTTWLRACRRIEVSCC